MLKNIDAYSVVAKVDVSDMRQSVEWYESKLDLVVDERFDSNPKWRQLNVKGIQRFAVGLNLKADGVGTGGAVTTFAVPDIESSRKELIARGVEVTEIVDVGQGVLLAFFSDPDGNSLGLRQNSKDEPDADAVGWQPG